MPKPKTGRRFDPSVGSPVAGNTPSPPKTPTTNPTLRAVMDELRAAFPNTCPGLPETPDEALRAVAVVQGQQQVIRWLENRLAVPKPNPDEEMHFDV